MPINKSINGILNTIAGPLIVRDVLSISVSEIFSIPAEKISEVNSSHTKTPVNNTTATFVRILISCVHTYTISIRRDIVIPVVDVLKNIDAIIMTVHVNFRSNNDRKSGTII